MILKYKQLLLNLGVMVFSVVIILLVLEVVLRISYSLYKDYNTEMWRYSSKIKVISGNKKVSHEHGSGRSGFFYGVKIATNSDGFRDHEYWIEKNPDTYRILMLGDSITLGWGVPVDKTFSKRIEKNLNAMDNEKKYEVINTGVGNYNTLMEVELLKDKGLKYHPDLIILNYYINDAEEIDRISSLSFLLKRNSYLYALLWDKISNLMIRFNDANYYRFYSSLYDDKFIGKKRMLRSINELGQIAHRNEIDLLIVVFPEFHKFKDYEFQFVTDTVKDAADKIGAHFLDLLPFFFNENPADIWVSREDAHPNARGHAIAADAITAFLIKEKIIPMRNHI